MSHLLHVFLLISLHEVTPTTDAHQWNTHDHFEQTIDHIWGAKNGIGFFSTKEQIQKGNLKITKL